VNEIWLARFEKMHLNNRLGGQVRRLNGDLVFLPVLYAARRACPVAHDITARRGAEQALRHAGALIPGLVVAAVLFFIVNSGLVSLVLALLNSQSAISIWRNCHRWAFPYYIGGAALAGLVTVYSQVCGWRLAFAMLPVMCMLYFCYESWIARAQSESPIIAG